MNKKINIIVILISSFIIIGTIAYKLNLNTQDEVYIVSENEENIEEDNIKIEKDYETNNIENNIEYKNKENTISKNVTIYVSGEVNNPGIVTIESDKRLYDAVEKLGGVTQNADLNRINLAIKLNDEEHYIIPKIGEDNIISQDISVNNIDTIKNEQTSKININTATIEELDNLPGVGEATANKILNYREENGIFKSIEEVKNVNGIGEKKYIDIKDKICIE